MKAVWWQEDWTEFGPDWVIACPGPSLDTASLKGLQVFPIIAVDGAAAHPTLPYDLWAAWDRPRAVHERCLTRARVQQPTILTNWVNAGAWEDLVEAELTTTSAIEPRVLGQHKTHDKIPMHWSAARLDRAPSWLMALRFAVFRGGATRIHFLGLDLAGEGYALDLPDLRQRTPDEWEGRWTGERRILEAARHLCSIAEIELVGAPTVARSLTAPAAPALDPSGKGEV